MFAIFIFYVKLKQSSSYLEMSKKIQLTTSQSCYFQNTWTNSKFYSNLLFIYLLYAWKAWHVWVVFYYSTLTLDWENCVCTPEWFNNAGEATEELVLTWVPSVLFLCSMSATMDENGTDIYSTVRSTEQIWTLIWIITRISVFFLYGH